jgi:hypothetical protein
MMLHLPVSPLMHEQSTLPTRDFRSEFVLPQTEEVVIPAAIAKTGKREVINRTGKAFLGLVECLRPEERASAPA